MCNKISYSIVDGMNKVMNHEIRRDRMSKANNVLALLNNADAEPLTPPGGFHNLTAPLNTADSSSASLYAPDSAVALLHYATNYTE